MSILVLEAGALTTVQDLGRFGHGVFGVAPSGAMDPWALRLGNLLVGNEESAAGLEVTLNGPTLAFETDAVIALTGSHFDAAVLGSVPGSAFERDVDARPAPHNESFRIRGGESLRVGKTRGGARGYLCVRGGINIPLVLGSASTHFTAGLGGADLIPGHTLHVGAGDDAPLRRGRSTETSSVLRALPGPQEEAFAPVARERFFGESWTVSTQLNRAGIRLEGPALTLIDAAGMDPEGVVAGSVQVPGNEQPIVLCADRPVTGGYVKIATVIEADLFLLGHARPGDTLRFARTTPEDARAAWRARNETLLSSIEDIS
jgi:antagonist of KipI